MFSTLITFTITLSINSYNIDIVCYHIFSSSRSFFVLDEMPFVFVFVISKKQFYKAANQIVESNQNG